MHSLRAVDRFQVIFIVPGCDPKIAIQIAELGISWTVPTRLRLRNIHLQFAVERPGLAWRAKMKRLRFPLRTSTLTSLILQNCLPRP